MEVKREVPGEYGLPVFGSALDRLDHFYGKDFFEKRIKEHNSTVFKVNMPPGPPFFPDSKVITVLDQKSFPVLFDNSKVSKKNTFTGTYVPSTGFTGGYRVLSYIGVEEPQHAPLKAYCMELMTSNKSRWIPELRAAAAAGFAQWDATIEKNKSIKKPSGLIGGIVSSVLQHPEPLELNPVVGKIALRFLTKLILDKDATEKNEVTELGIKLWIAPQIAPVLDAGLPAVIQEALMHTAPIPFIAVQPVYLTIVNFFSHNSSRALALAEKHGIERSEALHNLIFNVCFNAFGGFIKVWPSAFRWISGFTEFDLQAELRKEVRAAVEGAGDLNYQALESMELLNSTIYEVLRIEPPVFSQYARAKVDFVIETHTEAFNIKEGQMLYGYQPLVTRDPKVFEDPEEFKPKRFLGDGQELLKYVYWSNGPETVDPTVETKQCPGKNFVVFTTRLLLADFFLHYDSFKVGKPNIGGTAAVYPFDELNKRSG